MLIDRQNNNCRFRKKNNIVQKMAIFGILEPI